MAKFYLTNKAIEDLNGIWNYTYDKWSEKQADKYYQMLLNYCRDTADNPNLGKNYNGITNNLRGIKANQHIIFYRRIEENKIEITRILHGRMDVKNSIAD